MPAAEVEVSADLVRRLLADQHPDLARLPVEFLANGWDNELYRVGDELVARLPRRALGAQIITNEQRWLPGLAPRLPLPIPIAERARIPGWRTCCSATSKTRCRISPARRRRRRPGWHEARTGQPGRQLSSGQASQRGENADRRAAIVLR
jgi:hypothetical protein